MQTLLRLVMIFAVSLLPAAAASNTSPNAPSNPGLASAPTANPAANPTANPALRGLVNGVEDGSQQSEIVLSELAISVDQHGSMAQVRLEAELTNPSDDEVEARFAMQLPQGAVLTGYSLDIGGVMIPGSLIDQPKARQVYQDEVRGNIDPGLAEITKTNVFETRVYPIAPEGSRLISLTFVAAVDAAKGLTLPLQSAGPVGVFRLNASAADVAGAPTISLSNGPPAQFVRDGQYWRLSPYSLSEVMLSGSLQLAGALPSSAATASRHAGGDTFVTIADDIAGSDLSQQPPERVRVYWDTSRSRAEAMLETERALLSQFLQDTEAEAVEVVTFSSAAPVLRRFGADSAAAIDAHLDAQTYRGATSFAGLSDAARGDADLCLLFSDGAASLNLSQQFPADCPVTIIASGPGVDGQRVNRIAQDNGGQALFLDAQNSDEVLTQMKRQPVGVVSVRDASGKRLPYRTIPAANGRWSVIAKLSGNDDVTVRLSGVPRRDRRRNYTVNSGRAARHDAAGALWAAQEVARLADNPARRDQMQRLSRTFQVASPTMAFLVLERPDQYIAADIAPPEGFGQEWMAEYTSAKSADDQRKKGERDARLNFVVTRWEETREWWNTQFDQDGAMRQKVQTASSQQGQIAEAAAEAEQPDAISTPPSPPPPPPPPAIRSDASADISGAGDEEQFIVVTGARRAPNAQEAPAALSSVNAEAVEASSQTPNGSVVQVSLANVLSDRPYLTALNEAEAGERLAVLAEQENAFGSVPGFYFDVAEWFRLKGEAEIARQLLLSALDLPTSDDETLLIVAFRLERDGDFDTAIELLEALVARTDYRSQPKRILALTLAARARTAPGSARRDDLERAFELLSGVVLSPTDGRYEGLETVSLMELNALIPLIDGAGGSWSLDERLIAALDTDIRVVIEWTSADADLDLHVFEPSGEQVYYGNQRSALGAKLSNDMTNGYGPEEYVIRRAYRGDYKVNVQGFRGDRINPNGPGRAMVRLIRDFGRAGQSEQLIDAEIGFDRSNQGENDRFVAVIGVEDSERGN